MKTSVTIQNDVHGIIISQGTGFKGQNEEYCCYKIESTITKDGYTVSLGLKSSLDNGTIWDCHYFYYPLAIASDETNNKIKQWKEHLRKYLYSVYTHADIIKSFDDIRIRSSNIYTTLENKELF